MVIENLFDYSAHDANLDGLVAALTQRGAVAVARYLSRDWRGITLPEYQALRAAGIKVVLICEFGARDVMGGFSRGVDHAQYSVEFMAELGLPPAAPIYYTADDDFTEEEQDPIDDYLRGAASITGVERVGFYAGYYVLGRAHNNGVISFAWQTSAWSWVNGILQVQPWAHMLQYDYNDWVGGTNCDDVRAFQENYGQVDLFENGPIIVPTWPEPWKHPNFQKQLEKPVPEVQIIEWNGQKIHAQPTRRNVRLFDDRNTNQYTEPTTSSEHAGAEIKGGQRIAVELMAPIKEKLPSGKSRTRQWFQLRTGTWIPADVADPEIIIRPHNRPRPKKAA